MAVLAIGVALYSLRFWAVLLDAWPGVDAGIRGVIVEAPLAALAHMLVAPVALILGPFQFMPRLRLRHPRAHRLAGRTYVGACVIGGVGGLTTALHASGGPVAGWGFGILAVLWVGTTLAAWRAAVRGRFARHRLLMRFSYAMTFAAVTLRLQIPIGFAVGFPSYSAMSVWLAYTCWVPNVLLVAIHDLIVGTRRAGLPGAPGPRPRVPGG
jgi:uncharacterized membrane protein